MECFCLDTKQVGFNHFHETIPVVSFYQDFIMSKIVIPSLLYWHIVSAGIYLYWKSMEYVLQRNILILSLTRIMCYLHVTNSSLYH